jgi:hypothetical protein
MLHWVPKLFVADWHFHLKHMSGGFSLSHFNNPPDK